MTKKIFRSILSASMVILMAGILLTTAYLYEYFGMMQENELRSQLELAAAGTQQMGTDYLQQLHGEGYRLTWIGTDGTVLYDTQVDAQDLDSHADREEIQEAFTAGSGSSSRYSATLTEKTAYEAVRLADGTVLRISTSYKTAMRLVLGLGYPFLLITLCAAALSGILAHRMSKRIVQPLNQLDLEHPLENDAYEELSPLLNRIHTQHEKIDSQLHTLQQKTDEFDQITTQMQEGLVLLDKNGQILSINAAARALFQTDETCIGANFLTVDRQHDLQNAIQESLEKGHSQIRGQRGWRTYQFDVSRIESDGTTLGVVVLAFDVTEQMDAERNRREFTANVSHELKTPLQSIIGSADLIENGMVKPEDMPRFVGHIHKEATRLVTLIEDIIRLSQLDEGGAMPQELVAFGPLAQDVVDSLQGAAAAKQVTFSIEGDAAVFGVRRLLHEVLYNLCDNAIKYNVPNGRVSIRIGQKDGTASIAVSDTGIGIPPEHQSHVFERFYRVDKSHSKQSGGTGLGLSIVNHAVKYHHGTIQLESQPGKGTCITVLLPQTQQHP